VIGPTISQAAYEVGPEFFDRFRAEDEASSRYFANGEGDRHAFDLPGYGLHRLRNAGVKQARMDRPLHLPRPLAVLFLPPHHPCRRGRLRAAHLDNKAITAAKIGMKMLRLLHGSSPTLPQSPFHPFPCQVVLRRGKR
jgi:hypothetical protein